MQTFGQSIDARPVENTANSVLAPQPQRNHLATLDGLRGLAALAVLAVHVFGEMHLQASSGNLPLDKLIPHVHLAVDFFFMLSGFVIAKAYEAKLVTSLTFTQFMSIRLVRLYPLILISVTLGAFSLAIKVVMTHSPSVSQFLSATLCALAILPTTALLPVFPGELFPLNFPQWSLFFELVINVVYAAIVRWLTTPVLIAICAISFVPLCFAAAYSHQMLDIGMGLQPVGFIPADIWCGTLRVTFPFFLGILLCRRRLSWRSSDATSLILSIVFLAVLFLPALRSSWIYEIVTVAIIFPIILAVGATCQNGSPLNKFFLWVGELSYPLYITHNPVTKIVLNAFKITHMRLPDAVVVAICYVTAVLTAILLLHLWDQPVRKWLTKRLRRPVPMMASN